MLIPYIFLILTWIFQFTVLLGIEHPLDGSIMSAM
jgi:hypothetical protein